MPDDASETDRNASADDAETAPADPPKVIPAEELFGDTREVWIDFHGERYRLRITRRNKLILQK